MPSVFSVIKNIEINDKLLTRWIFAFETFLVKVRIKTRTAKCKSIHSSNKSTQNP